MKRFLLHTIGLLPWVLLAQPEPGEVFREYAWDLPAATETDFLRVGGPADYRTHPADLPATVQDDDALYWPTPLDLEDIDRAELVLETFLFQPGATDLAVRWNDGDWKPVPDAAAIPVPRYERPQLYNAVVPIEVNDLRDTSNVFRLRVTEGPAELQARYLIYGVMLRLYYKPRRKGGVRGEILLPHAGEALREDVQLVADLEGEATRIEYLAKYRDVNWAGDGAERRWQYFYHRGEIRNIVATTENLLKSEFWDTRWLPDQQEPIELAARIHGADGLIYFTEAVTELRLERDFSVDLFFPTGQPPRWDTRYGRFAATLRVPGSPGQADAARLYWASWSPCHSEGVYLNGVEVYRGENEPCDQYVQHEIALPPVILRSGPNQVVTARTSPQPDESGAGMKVLYPGPTLKVRYGEPASPPKELFQRAPERIFYTVIDTVVSENFPPQLEEIAADESLPPSVAPDFEVTPATRPAAQREAEKAPATAATPPTTPSQSVGPAATRETATPVRGSAKTEDGDPNAAPASSTPDEYVAGAPEPRSATPREPGAASVASGEPTAARSVPDTITRPVAEVAIASSPPEAAADRPATGGRSADPMDTDRNAGAPRPAFSVPGSPAVTSRPAERSPAVTRRLAPNGVPAIPSPRERRSRRQGTVVPSRGSAHSQRSYAGLYVSDGERSPFRKAMLLGDAVWQDYEVELNAKLLLPPPGSWLLGSDPLPYFALATHLKDDPSVAPGDSLGATAEFYVLPEQEAYLWRIVRDKQVLAEKMSNYPSLELGRDYQVKFRAEAKGREILYRVKCWPEGSPEPAGWDLEGRDADPADIGGYALLLPEEQSISFASVEVNPVVSEVRIQETADEGQAAFRIETPGATYLYQAAAGGFSSILDRHGNDWIDFHTVADPAYPAAAANAYRGLPNLVFGGPNDGAGHPGFRGCSSVQIDESRIRTTTLDGRWQWTWTFFDYYAELEVERVDPDRGYWFLYEGPPAGRWDPAAAFWYTDQGEMATDSLPDYYTGGGRVDQFRWAAFGQSYYDQIFYVAQRRSDELPDLGGYLGSTPAGIAAPDGMVVFGFGRGPQADPQLRQPERFVIGFTDLLPYAKVRGVIEGRLR